MNAFTTPAPATDKLGRNSLCACGSGRRYKHCCGSKVSATPPPFSSAVREKMHRALRHQIDAQFTEAKDLYEEVLRESRQNPDALNMLALVESNLGNTDVAMALIAEAVQLAPSAPMIRENERVISHLWNLRKFTPAIFDPAVDAYPVKTGERPLIHIYQIAGNPSGGSERHALDLADRLGEFASVVLWTQHENLPAMFTASREIKVIDEARGIFPKDGLLLIAGSYHRVGEWYKAANFRRTVVLYNVVDPIGLSNLLDQLCLPDKPKVELLFASELMGRVTGLPGIFEPSPIDTELFAPVPAQTATPFQRLIKKIFPARSADADAQDASAFVVGRLSRNDPTKFHPEAAGFFRAIAAQDCSVKIMGGSAPLIAELGGEKRMEILPENAIPAIDFLHSLDCFTYRTNPVWTEAWGRVVTEAMAIGLPVVVHANGGYAQIIRHRENGFLFHRDEEALEYIRALRDSPELRRAIGIKARQTILDLCSRTGFRRFLDFYLR